MQTVGDLVHTLHFIKAVCHVIHFLLQSAYLCGVFMLAYVFVLGPVIHLFLHLWYLSFRLRYLFLQICTLQTILYFCIICGPWKWCVTRNITINDKQMYTLGSIKTSGRLYIYMIYDNIYILSWEIKFYPTLWSLQMFDITSAGNQLSRKII